MQTKTAPGIIGAVYKLYKLLFRKRLYVHNHYRKYFNMIPLYGGIPGLPALKQYC